METTTKIYTQKKREKKDRRIPIVIWGSLALKLCARKAKEIKESSILDEAMIVYLV